MMFPIVRTIFAAVLIMNTISQSRTEKVEHVTLDPRWGHGSWWEYPKPGCMMITLRTEMRVKEPNVYEQAVYDLISRRIVEEHIPSRHPKVNEFATIGSYKYSPDLSKYAIISKKEIGPRTDWEYGVTVFDAGTHQAIGQYTEFYDSVTDVEWIDNIRVAAASNDSYVRIFAIDPQAPKGTCELIEFHGHGRLIGNDLYGSPVNSLDLSSDGKLAVSGDFQGNVILWEIDTGKIRHMIRKMAGYPLGELKGDEVTSVRFLPDGKRLAFTSTAGKLFVHDVATGKYLGGFQGALQLNPLEGLVPDWKPKRSPEIYDFHISPNGHHIVFGTRRIEESPFQPDQPKWVYWARILVMSTDTYQIVAELPEFRCYPDTQSADGLRKHLDRQLGRPRFIDDDKIMVPSSFGEKIAIWTFQ